MNIDLIIVAKALSSDTRLKILNLLANKRLSSIETYKEYKKNFNDNKHRETIYRELEILQEADILEKYYDKENKK